MNVVDRAFIDTNVFVYLYSTSETAKQSRAYDVICMHDCMTSIQVLTEFASVCTRKLDMPATMIDIALETIHKRYCFVCDVSMDLLSRALTVRERYGYSYYDSIVIASAIKYRCRYLFTEDMRDGQVLDGVEIVNIFRDTRLI